jgi:hypothetical protein
VQGRDNARSDKADDGRVLPRMTFFREANGQLRQLVEQSIDGWRRRSSCDDYFTLCENDAMPA